MVAGVLGATANNGIGIAGTNWQISVMPIKALDSKGQGDADTLAQAIVWAADNGAKIINMSLGSAEGPHDGTSLVDRTIDTLSKKPGHIVVGAAGNDGGKQTHATFKLGKGQAAGTWAVPVSSGGYQYFELEMWGQFGKSFSANFYLLDTVSMTYQVSSQAYLTSRVRPGKDSTYPMQRITWINAGKHDTAYLQISALEDSSTLNGKPHMQAALISNVSALAFGVKDSAPTTGDTIQVWNGYGKALRSFQLAGFADGDTIMCTNELGGTAKHNITVGGYIDKTMSTLWNGQPTPGNWDDLGLHTLTGFSGRGPTADGRIKPDICAPAASVVGALARDIDSSSVNIIYWPDHPASDDRERTACSRVRPASIA